MQDWLEAPFAYRFIHFKVHDQDTSLPFVIGGATQHGIQHAVDNQNNQDAAMILIRDKLIVGVLCDGCTSTHNELSDEISNNEVGAKLVALAVGRGVETVTASNRIRDDDTFLKILSQEIFSRLTALIELFAGPDENSREIFIKDFLITTVLGIVIDEENFTLFHCGDGIVSVNDDFKILEGDGKYYLAESLLHHFCSSTYSQRESTDGLKILQHGSTSTLNSVFLATDGFLEKVQGDCEDLTQFNSQSPGNTRGGFEFLLQLFRHEILAKSAAKSKLRNPIWPRDDASFLLVRRKTTAAQQRLSVAYEEDNQNAPNDSE